MADQAVADHEERFFPCPHCGKEIDRLQLVTFWREWRRLCYCPQCGWEADCPAFSLHPEGRA